MKLIPIEMDLVVTTTTTRMNEGSLESLTPDSSSRLQPVIRWSRPGGWFGGGE